VNVWGFDVRPPSLDRRAAAFLLARGFSGRRDRAVFERTIRRGDHVVDVGANQGLFTLLFSRLVGDAGRVLALEPEPRLFDALVENCRHNGARNVSPRRLAAGERNADGVLRCSPFNRGDNRMTGGVLLGSAVSVPVVPLDEIVRGERVDFVKIDVQGYEMHVFRGMRATLDANPGIRVYFEYWPDGLTRAGSPGLEPLLFLADRGFHLLEEGPSGARPVRPEEVALGTGSGHFSYRNLLATRQDPGTTKAAPSAGPAEPGPTAPSRES
jgi:FkbM family methyltransferase